MPKWVLAVAVVVVGVGVAVWALRPKDDTREATEEVASGENTTRSKPTIETTPEGHVKMSAGTPMEEKPEGPAEERPPNKAEVMLQARLSRPFNKHVDHVAAYWGLTTRAVSPVDRTLAKECEELSQYLLDMGRMNDGEMVVTEVLDREMALVNKIKALNIPNASLPGYLTYIEQSVEAVRSGGDPTTVPKPAKVAP